MCAREPGPEEAVIAKYWPDGMIGPDKAGVGVGAWKLLVGRDS